MKVHFTASIHAKDKFLSNYIGIVDYLKSKNFLVSADHILKASESKIHQRTKEESLAFYGKLEKWIKNCDFMIAETSFPSISVGFEISLGLRMGKPVLVMYTEDGPPSLLMYHKDERLIIEKYTKDNYKDIIDEFINYVEAKSDLRFTFFITPEINLYLEQISQKEKLPKSVYLRQLIEKDMTERNSA